MSLKEFPPVPKKDGVSGCRVQELKEEQRALLGLQPSAQKAAPSSAAKPQTPAVKPGAPAKPTTPKQTPSSLGPPLVSSHLQLRLDQFHNVTCV